MSLTGAAAVGGMQRPEGATPFTRAVALAMSSPLGAGDARYRLGGPEGPVDTVYLGVFRREALEGAGGFDETLARNQDYELNWRLRSGGGTVWFTPALAATYRPRASLAALVRRYFVYGWWKRVVLVRHPGSRRWRHLAAPALVAGPHCRPGPRAGARNCRGRLQGPLTGWTPDRRSAPSGVTSGVASPGQHQVPRLRLAVAERGHRHRFPSMTAGMIWFVAANDDGDDLKSRRPGARFAYGFAAFDNRFTPTPEAGAGRSNAGRDYSLDWLLARRTGPDNGSLEPSFEERRSEAANGNAPPQHSVRLRLKALGRRAGPVIVTALLAFGFVVAAADASAQTPVCSNTPATGEKVECEEDADSSADIDITLEGVDIDIEATAINVHAVHAKHEGSGNIAIVVTQGLNEVRSTIDTSGQPQAFAIYGQHIGTGTVSITVSDTTINTTGKTAHGVYGRHYGSGRILLNVSGSRIDTKEKDAHGIYGTHNTTDTGSGADGNISVEASSNEIITEGKSAYGIRGTSKGQGDVTITTSSNTVTTKGKFAAGIFGYHRGEGDIVVTSTQDTIITENDEGAEDYGLADGILAYHQLGNGDTFVKVVGGSIILTTDTSETQDMLPNRVITL